MEKRRVLLVCSQHLFGVGIETILRAAKDVELFGPWQMELGICQRIPEASPGVIVIVGEDAQDEETVHLTASILEAYPELPVIRVGLNENIFRVFSTHSHPARGTNLLETIRNLPETKNPSDERSE